MEHSTTGCLRQGRCLRQVLRLKHQPARDQVDVARAQALTRLDSSAGWRRPSAALSPMRRLKQFKRANTVLKRLSAMLEPVICDIVGHPKSDHCIGNGDFVRKIPKILFEMKNSRNSLTTFIREKLAIHHPTPTLAKSLKIHSFRDCPGLRVTHHADRVLSGIVVHQTPHMPIILMLFMFN